MSRILRALAWRGATAHLLFAYAVFLVFLAAWGATVPSAVVLNISELAPFWVLYLAVGVHLLCCLVVSWPTLLQRTSLVPPAADPGVPVQLPPRITWEEAARRAGLRLRWLPDERTAALFRNRFSAFGTVTFHAALLLLPFAFFASRATRFKGEAWIVEGHAFRGTRAEYSRVEPATDFAARAPRVAFEVESVEADFWGDRLFFTDLRALLALPRGETAEGRWIRLPQPALIDGARVSIRGFNYTPACEIYEPDGALRLAADLSLRLFPPGTEDSFAVPGLPHRVWVRLYPDADGPGLANGKRGFDLKKPLFHVAVTCGKRLVTHSWLRLGQGLPFDGYRLVFPSIRKGGDILVHRDRGYLLLWVALTLALAGSALRIGFPTTRVWLLLDGSGTRAVVREDAFARGRGAAILRQWGVDVT